MRIASCLLPLLLLIPASAAAESPLLGLAWNADDQITPEEAPFFRHLHQLTFDGENAEAYWSPDGSSLVFQRTAHLAEGEEGCDQIYTLDVITGETTLVSTGTGRTTCAYVIPGTGGDILFSSTHAQSAACPERPDYSQGYVWPIYADYDIYVQPAGGGAPLPVVMGPDYDAEAIVDRTGKRMVYTALREGDINLWVRELATGSEQQVTHTLGYDGGAVFSPLGNRIAWRAHYPETEAEQAEYTSLLEQHLIRPTRLDLYIANVDGSGVLRLTDNGAANFAPIFTPDGRGLVFSSNVDQPGGREFELFHLDIGTKKIKQLTHSPGFDGFPMFSYDGKYLAFCSNRKGSHEGNTNVYIAEWIGPGGVR